MPHIITDAKIEEGMKSRNISHQKMRSSMRKSRDRTGFAKGDFIMYEAKHSSLIAHPAESMGELTV